MDLISVLSTIISIFINPLVKISNKFFGIYLIKDKEMKDYLKKAKKKLKAKNYVACSVNIVYAFDLFIRKIRLCYKKASGDNYDIVHAIVPFETLISKKVIDLDYLEYIRFKPWLPIIHNSENDTKRVNIKRNYETEDTADNLKFCLKFLTNGILKNQNKFKKY